MKHLLRTVTALLVLVLLGLATCVTVVRDGSAAVVLRLGAPVRVAAEPGVVWHLPPPIERVRLVDLRLRSTSSGIYDVQTADGAVLAIEAFAGWQVRREEAAVLAFLRAVDGDAAIAAGHLRGLLGSSLQTVSGGFRLDALVGAASQKTLPAFEEALAGRLREELRRRYGIELHAVGLERLMVPERIVEATITAMVEERTAAASRIKAAGQERAGQLVAGAEAEARTVIAAARAEAATLVAEGTRQAATLSAEAWKRDPELYRLARSLDAVRMAFERQSAVVLRTDAAPFDALMTRPGSRPEPAPELDPDAVRAAALPETRP